MKRRFQLSLLAVLLAATAALAENDNALTQKEKDEGWRLLFNGTDLSGWKCNNGKPIATPVEKGSLVPYKSGGYIIMHEEQFDKFILNCDVRWEDPRCN